MLVHKTLLKLGHSLFAARGPVWPAHTLVPVVCESRHDGIRSVIMGIPQFHMDIINSMILKSFTFLQIYH